MSAKTTNKYFLLISPWRNLVWGNRLCQNPRETCFRNKWYSCWCWCVDVLMWWWHDNVTMWQHDNVTTWQHDNMTMWHYLETRLVPWKFVTTTSEPQTRAVFLLLLLLCFHIFYIDFKHQLLKYFFKLEHFLRQYFKTRSHDRSAHTFGSSLWFLEVPQKGVLKNEMCIFYHMFWHVWSYWIC